MKTHLTNIATRAKAHMSVLFFLSGFLFDLFTIGRIDQKLLLIQQAIFLLLLVGLLHLDILERFGKSFNPFVTRYKIYVMHFLFGALLSAYLIFYFLSSSGLNAFIFLTLIMGLMIINEIPRFQKLNIPFKTTLLCICLISYLSYLVPTLIGYVGLAPVFISAILYFLLIFLNCYILSKSTQDERIITRYITIPSVITLIAFFGLYFIKAIPPVPVSIKKMGIYRSVEKQDNKYLLSYARNPYKFWQNSESEFHYSAGEKVFCFASIFSPTAFNDHVFFEWNAYINGQWIVSDKLKIKITGGRDQGFRAFTYKSNLTAGRWRVKVLSMDDREIGRYTFNIIDASNPYDVRSTLY